MMICRKIYQKKPLNCGRWWRWAYSSAAPPLSTVLGGGAAAQRTISVPGSLSLLRPSRFQCPVSLVRPEGIYQINSLNVQFGIKICCFTTQASADHSVGGLIDVPLAQTGEGIAECELLKWFVQEGDQVEEFQPLCEVQSDKATIEITSRYKGIVSNILHSPGSIVKVGETLLKMAVDETVSPTQGSNVVEIVKAQDTSISDLEGHDSWLEKSITGGVLASPAVRSFARQLGIDIKEVNGSGEKGRVLREDILKYAAQKGIIKESVDSSNTSDTEYTQQYENNSDISCALTCEYGDKTVPIRGYQRAMVKSMSLAAKIPHFHYVEEINCDALLELKASFQNENTEPDVKHTFLPLLIKSLSMALTKNPMVNSCFNEELHEVTLKGAHNIGIAMATPYGLVVPNIKKVQSLSILEITKELARLQKLASANKLSPDDIAGGTITLSNIGAIGGKFGSPLVNVPEVSIIAIGRIQKLPHFAEDGNVYPVSVMTVNIGADHRVLDGATVARFCNDWKLFIEKPELLMLQMR